MNVLDRLEHGWRDFVRCTARTPTYVLMNPLWAACYRDQLRRVSFRWVPASGKFYFKGAPVIETADVSTPVFVWSPTEPKMDTEQHKGGLVRYSEILDPNNW